MSELIDSDGELFRFRDLKTCEEAMALLFAPGPNPKLAEALDKVKSPGDDRDTAMAKLITTMDAEGFLRHQHNGFCEHIEAMDALGLLAKQAGVKTTATLLRLIGHQEETCDELALMSTFRDELSEILYSFVAKGKTADETLTLCNAWLSSSDSRIGPLAKDTEPPFSIHAKQPPEWRCNQAALMLAMIGAFLDYAESGWLDLDAFGTADPLPVVKFSKRHQKSVARLRSLIATGGVGGGEALFDAINGRLISIHTTAGKDRRLTKKAWVGRGGLPGCFPLMSGPAYPPLFNCTVIVSPEGDTFVSYQSHLPTIEDWDNHLQNVRNLKNFKLKFQWDVWHYEPEFQVGRTTESYFRILAPCLLNPSESMGVSTELASMWNAIPLIDLGFDTSYGNLVGGPVLQIGKIIENPYDEENSVHFYRLCIAAFCRKLIELVVAEKPPFAIAAVRFVGAQVKGFRDEYKVWERQPIPRNPATEEMSKTLPWLRKMIGMFDDSDDNSRNRAIENLVKKFAEDFESLYEPFAAHDQDKALHDQVRPVSKKTKGKAKSKPNDTSV